MDDISIGSQMPEVFWDYGSPSPNAGKKCQAVATASANEHESHKVLPRNGIQNKLAKEMKPKNIYKIDSESLDKARNIIAKWKSCTSEPEQNSSLDWVFERSGNHEELCSSLSEQPTVSGKVDDELNEALPSDFWSEDIFNEPVSKCANNSKELDNNKVAPVVKTSTPLRGELSRQNVALKRKQLKRRSKNISDETTPSKCCIKTSVATNNISEVAMTLTSNAGDSLDFLMTFQPRNSCKRPPSSRKREASSSTPTSSKHADKAENSFPYKKPTKKLFEICKNELKSNNLSISDDVVSQLLLDDSWEMNQPAATVSNQHQSNIESELDSNVVTQILMDDCWTSDVVAQPSQKPAASSAIFRPLNTASVKNCDTRQSNRPITRSTYALNTVNLNVGDSTVFKKTTSVVDTETVFPRVPNTHTKKTPSVTSFVAYHKPYVPKIQTRADHSSSKPGTFNNFCSDPRTERKFKYPPVPLMPSHSGTSQKYTAAEIEQKRLLALQRKRHRMKQ